MRIFDRIKARFADLRRRNRSHQRARKQAKLVENGEYVDRSTFVYTDFDKDYDVACMIVRDSINKRFPDNYHARSMPDFDPHFNYSSRKSEAIDISSTAIAAALRKGKGISNAIEAGSTSIGL